MHARFRPFVSLLVVVLAILACGRAGTPAASSSERATALAETAAAVLTGTATTNVTPPSPTPLPTTTPAPTATEIPAATATAVPVSPTPAESPTPCINDSKFVADVTVPDGTHFAPGTAFIKTWRLENDGQCTWSTDYQLRHIGGEVMGASPVSLPQAVPPGGTLDISVNLVAPAANGNYTGRFQLFGPDGTAFGSKPYVQIVVP